MSGIYTKNMTYIKDLRPEDQLKLDNPRNQLYYSIMNVNNKNNLTIKCSGTIRVLNLGLKYSFSFDKQSGALVYNDV